MPIFEASLALRIQTETRPSTVPGADLGIFALEDVGRGKFIGMDFPSTRKVCAGSDIPKLPEEIRRYSWRLIEHVNFEAHDPRAPTDFLNHSFDPNILWHLGFYFTRKKIRTGDELFVDYRHPYSPGWWNGRLTDGATGREIDGMEWRQALARSCRQLLDLLEPADADPPDADEVEEVAALCRDLRAYSTRSG